MAGLFGSITIKGNRLTEFASQTATVGVAIPYGFGRFPCEGNVIFAPMPPKEHVKKKKQGKGGVKTEEYSYTLSYAVAFCEGPIYGFLTIKRNGKVVWTQDPNASVDDRAYAAKWKQKATFYYGTETQLPDSTIESYRGVGQVSAFRGIAYIVVEDDDVTDGGGAVPTYEAVIIAVGTNYVTTTPYALEDIVEVSADSKAARIQVQEPPREYANADVSVVPSSIEVRDMRQLQGVQMGASDVGCTPVSIEIRAMRTIQSVNMATAGVSAKPAAVEVKQTRQVLDRMQETKSKNYAKPISIEVVAP